MLVMQFSLELVLKGAASFRARRRRAALNCVSRKPRAMSSARKHLPSRLPDVQAKMQKMENQTRISAVKARLNKIDVVVDYLYENNAGTMRKFLMNLLLKLSIKISMK
jgi:hypothetical protein